MGTLAQEIRERKAAILGIVKTVQAVVTVCNRLIRLARRKASRRTALPDEKDLADILAIIREIINAVNGVSKLPADLANIFRL